MHLGRKILILWLAFSVAVLPTMAAVAAKSADMPQMSSSMDDMDCCPHKNPQAIDGCCSSMATCPMNCFGFAGMSSLIIFPLLTDDLPFAAASNPLHSQTGNPPFRPPRI